MSKFQTLVLVFFGAFILTGLVLLITFKGGSNKDEYPQIVIWGTIPAETFNSFIQQVNLSLGITYKISYLEKKESDFNNDLIENLARGEYPDAVLIPHDMVLSQKDKYLFVPSKNFYEANGQKSLSDDFIEQSEMFVFNSGILALPFTIDPLMMYWNRDILTSAGVALEPKYWDDLAPFIEKITKKDNNSNILRSAVALGEFRNVINAKEIFSALILQAGEKVVLKSGDNVKAVLGTKEGISNQTAMPEDVLAFYGSFSNPTKTSYTWNRSLPNSKNSFLGGNLAVYMGFASEFGDITNKNPNLNFTVSEFPQIKGGLRSTYGKMYVFAFPKASPYVNDAFMTVLSLIQTEPQRIWSSISGLPPIRRDLITERDENQNMNKFKESALISRAWLDPNKFETSKIFQNLIESYSSGLDSPSALINKTKLEIGALIKN